LVDSFTGLSLLTESGRYDWLDLISQTIGGTVNKEIADKWVTALRSGKYPQTQGALEVTPELAGNIMGLSAGFCCLGVLTSLAVEAGIVSRYVDESGNVAYGTDDDMCAGDLPDAVAKWADMHSSDGNRCNVEYHKGNTEIYKASLMNLNDASDYTFAKIADVIEVEFETL
jgi:hypothetical protein